VYVRDTSGQETVGKLLGLGPDTLVLLRGDQGQRFERSVIKSIQTRDSLKNGALIGAAVGVGLGGVSAGLRGCPGGHSGGHCGGMRIVLVGISTGVYAGLGTGVDALVRGRTTLYIAP